MAGREIYVGRNPPVAEDSAGWVSVVPAHRQICTCYCFSPSTCVNIVKWRKLEILRGLWIVVWQERSDVLACAEFALQSLEQTWNDVEDHSRFAEKLFSYLSVCYWRFCSHNCGVCSCKLPGDYEWKWTYSHLYFSILDSCLLMCLFLMWRN